MVGPQWRLSAILSADVVGHGKLVRDDETGTIEAVKRLLSVVIAPKLEEHAGRIVKLMGDGVLAEFPSVVEAVNFAVEAQAVADLDAESAKADLSELESSPPESGSSVEDREKYSRALSVARARLKISERG